MKSRIEPICRCTDGWGAEKRLMVKAVINDQVAFVVDRNQPESGVTAIENNESLAAPNAANNVRKGQAKLLGVDRLHDKLKINLSIWETQMEKGSRHSAGSSSAVIGVGQKMIAKLLGHSDTGATERYPHVQIEQTKPLVETRWARLTRTL
jgi:integrase